MDGEHQDETNTEVPQRDESYGRDDIQMAKQFWSEFWSWLRGQNIPVHGWIQALASVALLAVTSGQLLSMWSSSTQTDKLITAANQIEEHQKQLVLDNKQVLLDNRNALSASLQENRNELAGVLKQNRDALQAQTSAANGQLSAIQQQTEVAERPWISAEIVPSGGVTNESGDALRFSNDSVDMQFKFTMKNVGKSVALDVQPVGKFFTFKGEPFSQALSRQAEMCGKYKPPPNPADPTPLTFSTYLFPGDKKDFTLGVSIPYKEIVTLRAPPDEGGDSVLDNPMFIGCVQYRFSFGGELHHTFFNFNVNKIAHLKPGSRSSFGTFGIVMGENLPAKDVWISRVMFGNGNYID